MNQRSKISVVIPAYNAEQFILETLQSVWEQSLTPHEVILVDDGSKDNTAKLAREAYPQTTVIQKPNGGVSSARNTGVDNATGDYIAFIDADDLWVPDKLERQLDFMLKNPQVGTTISDELYFIDEGKVIVPTFMATTQFAQLIEKTAFIMKTPMTWLITQSFVPTSSVMCRAETIKEAGYFDTNLSICEDRDMWIRLAMAAEMAMIPDVLVKKRQEHGTNLSDIDRERVFKGLETVIERHREAAFEKITAEGQSPQKAYITNFLKFADYFWFADEIDKAKYHYFKLLKLGYYKILPRLFFCILGKGFVSSIRKLKKNAN